jgi:hypothetical protein
LKVTMMLADSAQEVGGKLYILGGGWSITGPVPGPSALAVKFDVPWDRTNHRLNVVLELLTSDGEPVMVPAPDGSQKPLRFDGQLEVGRPPGLKPGTPIDAAMALNFSPLPLQPDSRYEWRLSIDGHHEEDWSVAFTTRPVQGPPNMNR